MENFGLKWRCARVVRAKINHFTSFDVRNINLGKIQKIYDIYVRR